MSQRTPGPWTIRWSYMTHRAGSGLCRETCGSGKHPRRVWDDPDGLVKMRQQGHDEKRQWLAEMHEGAEAFFEQVLGPGGAVVFGVGQDYDDGGTAPSIADSCLIAAAPRLLDALMMLHEQIVMSGRASELVLEAARLAILDASPEPSAARHPE